MSMAWHNAHFVRMKKPPKLDTLLIDHDLNKRVSKMPEPWEVSYAKMAGWAMQSMRKH